MMRPSFARPVLLSGFLEEVPNTLHRPLKISLWVQAPVGVTVHVPGKVIHSGACGVQETAKQNLFLQPLADRIAVDALPMHLPKTAGVEVCREDDEPREIPIEHPGRTLPIGELAGRGADGDLPRSLPHTAPVASLRSKVVATWLRSRATLEACFDSFASPASRLVTWRSCPIEARKPCRWRMSPIAARSSVRVVLSCHSGQPSSPECSKSSVKKLSAASRRAALRPGGVRYMRKDSRKTGKSSQASGWMDGGTAGTAGGVDSSRSGMGLLRARLGPAGCR